MNHRNPTFPGRAGRPGRPGRRSGFTMTELALCVAVVSIALVAIIGVLPTGLNVQRQNREETIVNEDGKVLLNAIRTGAIHNDNLTNYVDFILYERYPADKFGRTNGYPPVRRVYYSEYWKDPDQLQKLNALGFTRQQRLTNSAQIVSLLTAERNIRLGNDVDYVNVVRAQFRAISGSFTEKPLQPSRNAASPDGLALKDRTDFSFRYLVTPEITLVPLVPGGPVPQQAFATAQNLRELSLVIEWPVTIRPLAKTDKLRVGNNRRLYRTQVYGQLLPLSEGETKYLVIEGLKRFSPNSL